MRNKALTEPMLEILKGAVQARLNIVVSGGTGAGKTTLLNVLSGFISESERIITIEDSAELQVKHEHVVRLECRPPNVEGKGAVRQTRTGHQRASYASRPDRAGRGSRRRVPRYVTGHEHRPRGSLTTIHANTPRDAIARMETMAMMGSVDLPEKAIRAQIASAIHLIVQIARMSDGSRRVTYISELTGVVQRCHQHAGHLPF